MITLYCKFCQLPLDKNAKNILFVNCHLTKLALLRVLSTSFVPFFYIFIRSGCLRFKHCVFFSRHDIIFVISTESDRREREWRNPLRRSTTLSFRPIFVISPSRSPKRRDLLQLSIWLRCLHSKHYVFSSRHDNIKPPVILSKAEGSHVAKHH